MCVNPDIALSLARMRYEELLFEAARERRGSKARRSDDRHRRGLRSNIVATLSRVFASRLRPSLRLASR